MSNSITNNKIPSTIFSFLFFIILFLLAFPHNGQTLSACYSKVLRVIDGDTFVLTNGEKVRLLGVDTPEMDSKDAREKEFAIEATRLIKNLVEGKIIKLTFEGKTKDIFGRTLAYTWLTNKEGKDSIFLQAEILKAGLARILMYSKGKTYYNLFYNLRNTA